MTSAAQSPGRVFWITGLSGSGKTTIAALLTQRLRERGLPVIFLDGDVLRETFGDAIGHDAASRLAASLTYARLCRMLAGQDIDVVCATVSMFHETRAWNRANIGRYTEVYVRVPMEELARRDSKRIYSRAASGELKNVVGVDLPCEAPENPDMVIDNYGEMTPARAVERILQGIPEGA